MNNVNWNWNWVREFPDKPWNWKILSESPYFNWNWVREFPDKPWNWVELSDRIDSLETVKEFQDKPWCWYTLTLGSNTTISDIMNTPNFPWDIKELYFTNIDEEIIQFIRLYRSHYDKSAWCDHTAHASWKLIKKNMDLPWVFSFVKFSSSSEFEESDVHYLYEIDTWNWQHLSEFMDFHSIISRYMDRPWDFSALSRNKTVTYRDVMRFPDIPWNYNTIHLDEDMREWRAADVIKRYWKRCATDPNFKMCRKIVLCDLFGALDGRYQVSHVQCDAQVQ
jgi:hypothetical protein